LGYDKSNFWKNYCVFGQLYPQLRRAPRELPDVTAAAAAATEAAAAAAEAVAATVCTSSSSSCPDHKVSNRYAIFRMTAVQERSSEPSQLSESGEKPKKIKDSFWGYVCMMKVQCIKFRR
jgi:hypothetical protein